MKEYTIASVRKWGTDNIYSVTFEEDKAEPTDWFNPSAQPSVGEKATGRIENYETNNKNVRRRFITKELEVAEDKRQMEINSSWAITNALQIAPDYEKEIIKGYAEMLLDIKKELMDE